MASRSPRAEASMGGPSPDPSADELYARLYDVVPLSWPGELERYRMLAAEAPLPSVLEIASGTGRVAIALAREGFHVAGIDRSAAMVALARARAAGLAGIRFEVGDMRSFDLGERFGLTIVPAHSFQFMTSADDQVEALRAFRRHLVPDGRLVLHLDRDSSADLLAMDGQERPGRVRHDPETGTAHRPFYAWTYDAARQDATLRMGWDELDAGGVVVRRRTLEPMILHVPSATEIEHALRRAGFVPEDCWGDFGGTPFGPESGDMIWVARAP